MESTATSDSNSSKQFEEVVVMSDNDSSSESSGSSINGIIAVDSHVSDEPNHGTSPKKTDKPDKGDVPSPPRPPLHSSVRRPTTPPVPSALASPSGRTSPPSLKLPMFVPTEEPPSPSVHPKETTAQPGTPPRPLPPPQRPPSSQYLAAPTRSTKTQKKKEEKPTSTKPVATPAESSSTVSAPPARKPSASREATQRKVAQRSFAANPAKKRAALREKEEQLLSELQGVEELLQGLGTSEETRDMTRRHNDSHRCRTCHRDLLLPQPVGRGKKECKVKEWVRSQREHVPQHYYQPPSPAWGAFTPRKDREAILLKVAESKFGVRRQQPPSRQTPRVMRGGRWAGDDDDEADGDYHPAGLTHDDIKALRSVAVWLREERTAQKSTTAGRRTPRAVKAGKAPRPGAGGLNWGDRMYIESMLDKKAMENWVAEEQAKRERKLREADMQHPYAPQISQKAHNAPARLSRIRSSSARSRPAVDRERGLATTPQPRTSAIRSSSQPLPLQSRAAPAPPEPPPPVPAPPPPPQYPPPYYMYPYPCFPPFPPNMWGTLPATPTALPPQHSTHDPSVRQPPPSSPEQLAKDVQRHQHQPSRQSHSSPSENSKPGAPTSSDSPGPPPSTPDHYSITPPDESALSISNDTDTGDSLDLAPPRLVKTKEVKDKNAAPPEGRSSRSRKQSVQDALHAESAKRKERRERLAAEALARQKSEADVSRYISDTSKRKWQAKFRNKMEKIFGAIDSHRRGEITVAEMEQWLTASEAELGAQKEPPLEDENRVDFVRCYLLPALKTSRVGTFTLSTMLAAYERHSAPRKVPHHPYLIDKPSSAKRFAPERHSHTPTIDSNSRRIATKVVADEPRPSGSVHDKLYHDAHQRTERLEEDRELFTEHLTNLELAPCSFKPAINPPRRRAPQANKTLHEEGSSDGLPSPPTPASPLREPAASSSPFPEWSHHRYNPPPHGNEDYRKVSPQRRQPQTSTERDNMLKRLMDRVSAIALQERGAWRGDRLY